MGKFGLALTQSAELNTQSRILTVVHDAASLALLDNFLIVEGVHSAEIVPHWRQGWVGSKSGELGQGAAQFFGIRI